MRAYKYIYSLISMRVCVCVIAGRGIIVGHWSSCCTQTTAAATADFIWHTYMCVCAYLFYIFLYTNCRKILLFLLHISIKNHNARTRIPTPLIWRFAWHLRLYVCVCVVVRLLFFVCVFFPLLLFEFQGHLKKYGSMSDLL